MSLHHACSCSCGSHHDCHCHEQGEFHRRFQTKAEQVEELRAYLQELESEVSAVKERLAELEPRS